MRELHIFTGGKGGVGKTMFSLCSFLHYANRDSKILLIDLNFTNPNIIHMFHYITNKRSSPINEDIQMQILDIDDNKYIAFPAKLHILPNSIVDVYKCIFIAYSHLSKVNNFQPDAIIVDTNLSLANFWTDSPVIKEKIKDFFSPIIENYNPFYWHIWALSDFVNVQPVEGKISGIRNAFPIISSALEEIQGLWGNKFSQTKNLINIFNIYALYPRALKDSEI
jgi:hypothetical protein